MHKTPERIAWEKKYWDNHKQIKVTVSHQKWAVLKKRADQHGKTVGQLLLAEAEAYQVGVYLPTLQIEERLTEISRLIRNIGGLINQLAKYSNTFKRAVDDRKVLQMLQRLERDVDAMVRRAWRKPTIPPTRF